MIEIYTPKEWSRFFGGAPSLYIKDDGYIYTREEEVKLMGRPCGRIDYSKGYIYGSDYASANPDPVGYLRSKHGITEIYAEYPGWNVKPILVIKGNKIYTYSEYTRIMGGNVIGYIKEEKLPNGGSGGGDPDGGGSGGGGSDGGGSGGGGSGSGGSGGGGSGSGGSGGGGTGDPPHNNGTVPVLAILIGIVAIYFFVKELWEAILQNPGLVLCIFSLLPLGYFARKYRKQASAYKSNTALVAESKQHGIKMGLIACVIPAAIMLIAGASNDNAAKTMISMIFLLLPFVATAVCCYNKRLAELGAAEERKQKIKSKPVTKPTPKSKPVTKPTPESKPVTKPTPESKPVTKPTPESKPQPVETRISSCPHCGAKFRAPAGVGTIRITCPNPDCKMQFTLDT